MKQDDFGIRPFLILIFITLQIIGLCKLAVMLFEWLVKVLT